MCRGLPRRKLVQGSSVHLGRDPIPKSAQVWLTAVLPPPKRGRRSGEDRCARASLGRVGLLWIPRKLDTEGL